MTAIEPDADTSEVEPAGPAPTARTSTRRTVAPLARLAFRRAERPWRHWLLLVVAIALPVAVGSLVVPVAIGPDPLALIFTLMVAAVIALSVGAVLAVSTRGQLLRYGRLSAIGAGPGQIRWLLALESLPAAIVGYLIGTVSATALSIAVGPLRWVFEDDRDTASLSSRWATIAIVVAIGQVPLLLSTGLGLWLATAPAARMAERSPTESLAAAGPEPELRPFQGWIGVGLATGAIGYCLLAGFSPGGLMLAVIAVFVGVHLCIGPILVRLDRWSTQLPRSIRLAVRNGARSRTRFGRLTMASIATVALGVMATAGILSDAPGGPNSAEGWGLDERFVLVPAALIGTDAEDRVRDIVDIDREAEIQLLDSGVTQVWARDDNGFSISDLATAILTPELATALGPDTETLDAIDRGAIVMADGSRRSLAVMGGDGPGPDLDRHTTRLGLGHAATADPRRPSRILPTIGLVSADRAAELGARPQPAGRYLLLVADRPLDGEQRDDLAMAATGSVIVAHPSANRLDGMGLYWLAVALAAGFLAAFGLIGAALSGAETEEEISTMIANGADPSIRRWFRANQSALQLLAAGIVGAPLGVLLFWAITRTDPSVPDPIVPWEAIGALGLGVPVVVYALVAASTGSGAPTVSRRGLA